LKLLGLFAHYLGIRPWEVSDLTIEEFELLADWVEKHNEAQASGGT
jgi:hypothetical protein